MFDPNSPKEFIGEVGLERKEAFIYDNTATLSLYTQSTTIQEVSPGNCFYQKPARIYKMNSVTSLTTTPKSEVTQIQQHEVNILPVDKVLYCH